MIKTLIIASILIFVSHFYGVLAMHRMIDHSSAYRCSGFFARKLTCPVQKLRYLPWVIVIAACTGIAGIFLAFFVLLDIPDDFQKRMVAGLVFLSSFAGFYLGRRVWSNVKKSSKMN